MPVAVDPEAHDRLVALTSHLPHALANVLLNQAGAARVDGHEPLAAAGGSLRDMTRVAGANPRIWVDIFLENRDGARARRSPSTGGGSSRSRRALAAGDAGFLARWIGEAAANRRRLLETAYDDAGALQRLRVHVPDRPGVIAGIAQALGAERINIADFDLQHLSTERGGTLAILVAGEEEAARAAAILEEQGYGVVVAPVLERGRCEGRARDRGARGHIGRPGRQVDLAPRGVLLARGRGRGDRDLAASAARPTRSRRSRPCAPLGVARLRGRRRHAARLRRAGCAGCGRRTQPIDCGNAAR